MRSWLWGKKKLLCFWLLLAGPKIKSFREKLRENDQIELQTSVWEPRMSQRPHTQERPEAEEERRRRRHSERGEGEVCSTQVFALP